MLITSIFSLSHNVLDRLFLQGCKNKGLLVIELITVPHILDWSKFKAILDDVINSTAKLKFVSGSIKNFEKGRECLLAAFSLFQQWFHHGPSDVGKD